MTRGSTVRRVACVLGVAAATMACSPSSSQAPATPAASASSSDSDVPATVSSEPSAAPSPTASPGAADPTSGTDATAEPTSEDDSADPAGWEVVAEGFEAPVATMLDPRSGDLLVVQLGGQVRGLDGTTVLDISDRVTAGGERGLLDVTATPDGTRLLAHYSGDEGATTLASFPVLPAGSEQVADRDGETILMTVAQPAANHNGGTIMFGPDGFLYMALGDGGGGNDQFGNGDNLETPLGAILRLDVDADPATALPAPDNPWVDGGGDARIWASGVRNPWRITHDDGQWFVADVGQNATEEVSIVPADAGPHDLGWPSWEGDQCRLEPCDDQSIQPVATLAHADGACSIIGGAVAARPTIDDGAYFFTDLCDQRVWRLDPSSGEVAPDSQLPSPALALDLDVDGSVVALTRDGAVLVRTR